MRLSKLAKRMIAAIGIISAACILGSVIFYRSLAFLPFMYGVLLGAAAGVVRVFLLERSIAKMLEMESKRGGYYAGLQQFLWLIIAGAALVLGALVPQISLWGTAAGVLSYQLAIYVVKLTDKKRSDKTF